MTNIYFWCKMISNLIEILSVKYCTFALSSVSITRLWFYIQHEVLAYHWYHMHLYHSSDITQGDQVVIINWIFKKGYRQTSNTSRTKSQNLYGSRLVLGLSLRNPLSREWRCSWSSATGDDPTSSECSTTLLPTKVRLILEIWRYFLSKFQLKLFMTKAWVEMKMKSPFPRWMAVLNIKLTDHIPKTNIYVS